MQPVNAISVSSSAFVWLTNSRHPRILHVFEHACNLVNEYQEVLSIVTPQIGNGPFNLVIEEDICFSEHLGLESRVSTFPTGLQLGNLIVHVADAKTWNARPDWERLHTKKSDVAAQLTKLLNANYQGRALDMGIALAQPNSTSVTIQSLASTLSSSLTIVDLPSSLTAARQLAGLGAGLTPSGDDILMGAIYAVWIIHPSEIARVLATEIGNVAAPLTTSLSAAWLKSAGRGEAGILWHEFFNALVLNDPMRIAESKKNILAVGETSGADALAGFFGVFASWTKKTGSPYG